MPPARLEYGSTNRKTAQKLGLTQLQKYEVCCLRMKNAKVKLSSFATLEECPRRPDARYMAILSLSDHLKYWEKTFADVPQLVRFTLSHLYILYPSLIFQVLFCLEYTSRNKL